jgi:phosphatidylserine decarboxylase
MVLAIQDFVGEVPLLLSELTEKAPKPDPKNGIFPVTVEGKVIGDDLYDFVLPLGSKSAELEDTPKEQTLLTIRAKFTPYSALRQRFWRT